MKAILFLALSGSLAAPATSSDLPPPLVVSAPAPRALAMGVEIAKLLNPEGPTLSRLDVTLKAMLQKMFAANADVVKMDQMHPGFTAAGSAAILSTTHDILKRRLPLLWDRLGAAYARHLSEPELQQVLAFYRTPAAQRLVQATIDGVDASALLEKHVAAPANKLGSDELKTVTEVSATKAAAAATPEDRTAIANFVFTPLGLKIREMNPEMLKIATDWSNERDPADAKRVEEATAAALAPFLAAASGEKKAKP